MKIEKCFSAILLNEWDPLGIRDDKNAKCEYDQQALQVFGMLYNGATEDKIENYLKQVETEEYGLKCNVSIVKKVAKLLVSTYQSNQCKKWL